VQESHYASIMFLFLFQFADRQPFPLSLVRNLHLRTRCHNLVKNPSAAESKESVLRQSMTTLMPGSSISRTSFASASSC
jgi:hypothetical protein